MTSFVPYPVGGESAEQGRRMPSPVCWHDIPTTKDPKCLGYSHCVNQPAILGTDRLILRQWLLSDREPFVRLNANPRVMEFFPALLSPEESISMIDHIQAHFDLKGFGPYAVEFRRDHTFIGFIGLNIPTFEAPFTPCVEVAWRLAPEYWGQGLATEGARAVTEYGFQQLKLREIVAFTVPANVRSRRVMEKLGMKHNSADDFDHPQLPAAHPLGRHVLYRLSHSDWRNSAPVP